MGYSLSWVAFRGRSSDDVWGELQLKSTGAREEIPESPLVGATLPNGWSLLLANYDVLRFYDDDLLARLSAEGEAVACLVEEHEMASHASGWKDGKSIWALDHDGSGAPGRLEIRGDPPTLFGPIRQELEEQQGASDGTVDYLFDAPIELAKAVVGFRHDECRDDGDIFEQLADVRGPTPKKGFWARLLGR